MLTPQGKYLADFFILADGATLLLDCERAQISMLAPKLSRFRLRSKSPSPPATTCGSARPGVEHPIGRDRCAGPAFTGSRMAADLPKPPARHRTPEDWDRHRLALALPDGTRDLEVDKTVLLEAGFDELHGLSWTKGCYMGQELTARTKYRGLLKTTAGPGGGRTAAAGNPYSA